MKVFEVEAMTMQHQHQERIVVWWNRQTVPPHNVNPLSMYE